MGIIEELEWRGLISDCTDREGLAQRLAKGAVTLYCGFDPTADSLHVGSLVPLLALRRFQQFGHKPIVIAGGATGSIGDPSGKSAERQLLTHEQLKANIEGVKKQLASFLDFDSEANAALLVDNADWTAPLSFLDVLRDVGKHFKVNAMVAKESVRARMENRDVGISFTEFSYMILQALDFDHLYKQNECELQIGGSDQWGNITAGIDLIHRRQNRQAYGLTMPLITNSDGTKFGKTEAGAVWLDVARTSIYQFYQYWVRVDDRDVVRYLNFFTFLHRDEIEALARQHAEQPHARVAHKALARESTAKRPPARPSAPARFCSAVRWTGSPRRHSGRLPVRCRRTRWRWIVSAARGFGCRSCCTRPAWPSRVASRARTSRAAVCT